MKKIYATMLLALVSLTTFAQETNDTTYVMIDFTQNPWNYPVAEVTKGWQPSYKAWTEDPTLPGYLLNDTDFSWPITSGSSEKVKVTLYACDIDQQDNVSVYAHYVISDAEAARVYVENTSVNMVYTQATSTLRLEAPTGYKFGKIVFITFNGNIMVGDEYDEVFTYVYNKTEFTQKQKVWVPTSPKKNTYEYDIWEGDEKNILFNYKFMNAVFVKIDIRLVPDGSAGINNLRIDGKDAEKTYTLDGREVNKVNGLPKGVYIKDGKKVIVK